METSLPKLSLEPRLGSAPFDVLEPEGTEIYNPKSTPSDNLREQVRKIYSQREFKNLTEENDDSEKMEEKNEQGSTSVKDLDDFLSMKISIRQAVEQSNNEIGIGIDILNLILSCRPGFNPDNPLPINPGLIQHTCHAYSPPTKPFEVQNLKLMLGMKRKQIKNSAELLLNAAKKLNDIVKKEESFWSEALSLRERYWSMCRGGKEKNAGHQIFVNYGYSDATATCLAQILRSPEERKIVVSLPKRSKRAVKLKLQQRSNNLGGGIYRVQENSLPRSEVTDDSSIHQQLVAAQKSIFEAELIDQVIREARSMPSVTLVENEIFIRIYQDVDLTIQWDNIETTEESPSTSNTWTAAVEADNFDMTISPESSTCTVLKLAMELMVRRYHRRHLLKQQERMLHGTKGPIREINHAQILSHLIHLLKYHFFCDHIREIVNASTKALRNGGIPVQIHFISNMSKGKDFVEDVWKKIGNDKVVPLITGMIIITIDRRRSLRFTLESPASVTVHLTHTDIKTRDLTKFQDLLSREINLFLLKIVHEQLNYLTGLDNVLFGNSTWLLDPAMMAIYKDVPPVLTNSEVKWPKALWRRPVKILIVNEHPSPDNLTLKVEAVGIDKCPELVIGKGLDGEEKANKKEFGERVFEFLINLV